jgi:hypothetical protein
MNTNPDEPWVVTSTVHFADQDCREDEHGNIESIDVDVQATFEVYRGLRIESGTTCVAAKRMGRRFIGIDNNPAYVEIARERVEKAIVGDTPILVVGTPVWPTQAEAVEQVKKKFETIGREAGEAKHKRRTYGRAAPVKAD